MEKYKQLYVNIIIGLQDIFDWISEVVECNLISTCRLATDYDTTV